MARILIVVIVFPPDAVSTAQVFGELAQDLQARGHEVTVLSTVPHYNPEGDGAARAPMRGRLGGLFRTSEYHGIRVYHAWMPRKGGRITGRLLAWVWFHASTTIAGLTVIRGSDLIITPSPPLTNGIQAWLLGAWHRAPYVYNVQEIYPDIAVKLGALRNRVVIRGLQALERFVYRRAAAVTVIAPRMRDRLVEKGADPGRVHVIPNFVDEGEIQPMPKDNPWSRRHGLQEVFVVSYAGAFGPAQGLDIMIDAARHLRNDGRIRFVLVGSGTLWTHISRRVEGLQLDNVRVLPQEPYALVPEVYGASDMCVVPQSPDTGADAIPSKVYRIMAAARPVLACTDTDSDLAQLVRDSGCGVVVSAGSGTTLSDVVQTAVREPASWRAMGEAGRRYVVQHYRRQVVTGRYHQLVTALAPTAALRAPAS